MLRRPKILIMAALLFLSNGTAVAGCGSHAHCRKSVTTKTITCEPTGDAQGPGDCQIDPWECTCGCYTTVG